MAIKKRTLKLYPQVVSTYNETSPLNPSHLVDDNSNFVLRDITLEDIDKAVWESFHRKIIIAGKPLNLIPLDADIASFKHQIPDQFGKDGYIKFPYFTLWRNNTSPLTRTSPSNKPLIYVIPKTKAQGVVYEEYIMPPPQLLKATYTMKFTTTLRENINTFEEFMLEYFKNKRNIIIVDNERFEIQPENSEKPNDLEVVEREGANGMTLYTLTYEVGVICYLRDMSQVQKRERPNTWVLQIGEKSGNILQEVSKIEGRYPTITIDKTNLE
jgi:hypothetical protein